MNYEKATIKIGKVTIKAPTIITPSTIEILMNEQETKDFLKSVVLSLISDKEISDAIKQIILQTLKEKSLIR